MSMDRRHILVVDDDTRLRRLLRQYLSENGFEVSEAPSADEARLLIKLIAFDLIVMDVMMPGTNGQDMVRIMRGEGNQTPVLMLTAMGDIDNRIIGLEAGADDYLSKPFEPRELVLRIHSILKRVERDERTEAVAFGACIFDPRTGILSKDGQGVALTGAESELLRILVKRAGEAVSREELGQLTETDNARTIDVQITRLRKKVETDIGHPVCIQTVRGQGYMLVTK